MNWKAGDGENITLNYPITLQNKTLIAVLSDTSGKIDASSNEGAYIVQYSSKDVEIRNAWSNNYANTITAIFILGFQKQWGTGTDSYNVVFPVQFTAEVFALAGIVQEDYNGGRDTMTYANLTTAGFLMIINTSYPAKYIAIGR